MPKAGSSAKSGYSPVKSGGDPRNDATKNMWLKLDPGKDGILVTSLVEKEEIISCEQCAIWLETDGSVSPVWVYTGKDDPANDLGVDRRYRAYLPVYTEDGEVRVWSMGKGAHGQILDAADANGGKLRGLQLRLKRTGTGLQTRYSVMPTGKRKNVDSIEEVDVISLLGPLDVDGVRQLIAERLGFETYDDVLEKYAAKGRIVTAERKSGTTKGKVAPVKGKHASTMKDEDDDLEEEDDEDDDVELT